MAKSTLKQRIEDRISRETSDVFLPREFADLGGQDQVLRALRTLVQEQQLVKLGYGVYARALVSRLTGKPLLNASFLGSVKQVLNKLGVTWEPTKFQNAYNEGRSTQVPVNPILRIKGRFSRKLSSGNAVFMRESR
jgi:Family of unknown function (DUF6088)